MYQANMYEEVLAETIALSAANGDPIHAFFSRRLEPGPFPAIVLAHRMPGWDE